MVDWKDVSNWIKRNPGTGLVTISGSADFHGDRNYRDLALVDRWGVVQAIYRKRIDGEESDV